MGWQEGLLLVIGLVLIGAGVIAFLIGEAREDNFVSNAELNKHKVTPQIPFAMRDHK